MNFRVTLETLGEYRDTTIREGNSAAAALFEAVVCHAAAGEYSPFHFFAEQLEQAFYWEEAPRGELPPHFERLLDAVLEFREEDKRHAAELLRRFEERRKAEQPQ